MNDSIEMRNPFLDFDLVEFCLNLPGKFKISNYSLSHDYSKTRLTVDWEEDFILVEKIFNFCHEKKSSCIILYV